MLSNEQVQKLSEYLKLWQASGVSPLIAQRVEQLARADLDDSEQVKQFCEEQLWSPELVGWYEKFLDFVRSMTQTPTETTDVRGEVLQGLSSAIAELQRIQQKLEALK